MVLSTSNLVQTFIARYASRNTFYISRSTRPEVEIWRTFNLSNAKINRKRSQIAEISCPITKSEWWCQSFNRIVHKSPFLRMSSENVAKIALNAVKLPKFEAVNGKSCSPRTMAVEDLRRRSRLTWFCACAESCVVFNTGPYTVLPDNSIYLYRSAKKVI